MFLIKVVAIFYSLLSAAVRNVSQIQHVEAPHESYRAAVKQCLKDVRAGVK